MVILQVSEVVLEMDERGDGPGRVECGDLHFVDDNLVEGEGMVVLPQSNERSATTD